MFKHRKFYVQLNRDSRADSGEKAFVFAHARTQNVCHSQICTETVT